MIDTTNTTVAPITKPLPMVLPGGRGQLGRILARHFHSQGHHVTVPTRTSSAAPWRVLAWDGVHLDRWVKELEGADVLINLTGRSVNCRYGAANRRQILESRIAPTRLLGAAIGKLAQPPRLWMNASTATIYRHSMNRAMDEATGELRWMCPRTQEVLSESVPFRVLCRAASRRCLGPAA
jgi:NAD dependent epimerase/dehydratase family enzyme